MSVIHFNGIDSQEFNKIMSKYRLDYGEKFTFVEDGEAVVQLEGYKVGVASSLKQLYSKKIESFPNFRKEDRRIFLPIAFLTHGDVEETTFDHLAMMYVDLDSGIVHYYCQLRGDIYEKAAKTNIIVRLRAQYPGVRLKYKKHRFPNAINQYYPDSCALFALWIMRQVILVDGKNLELIRLPSFGQLHCFRKTLALQQDQKVMSSRKRKGIATSTVSKTKSKKNRYLLQNICARNLHEGINAENNHPSEESSKRNGAESFKLTSGPNKSLKRSPKVVLKDTTNKARHGKIHTVTK